jgi:hypothetical protein
MNEEELALLKRVATPGGTEDGRDRKIKAAIVALIGAYEALRPTPEEQRTDEEIRAEDEVARVRSMGYSASHVRLAEVRYVEELIDAAARRSWARQRETT